MAPVTSAGVGVCVTTWWQEAPGLGGLDAEGAFDESVEWGGGFECFHDIVEEPVAADEVLRNGVHAAVVAVFEQVDVGPVGRVAFGRAAEFLGGEELVAIVAVVVFLCHDGFELVGTIEDLLPDGSQLLG